MSSDSSMDKKDIVILDFLLLISMHVACLKSRRPSLNFPIFYLEPSHKINMSSTNSRCEIYSPIKKCMPLKVLANFASIKK